MEKEKVSLHPSGLPPHSSRLLPHPSLPSTSLTMRLEVPSLSPSQSEVPVMESSLANSHFSQDINNMPDIPPRKTGHRRAHSEIVYLPDDISFDNDLGFVGADCRTLSDETEVDIFSMYIDMEKFAPSPSVTSGLALGEMSSTSQLNNGFESGGMSERPRIRHQHSQSMDGSTSIKAEMLVSPEPMFPETKKAMSAAKLADLALTDPKRAKRIWANRQSAARSKERKMRYIAELERKVQTLQTEATTLSDQLTMLQRDTNGLTSENTQLKLRLQGMEQQVHLQDALNEALRDEAQRLKLATGRLMPNGGKVMNFGSSFSPNQQFYPNPNAQSFVPVHQFQQLQIQQNSPQMTELSSQSGGLSRSIQLECGLSSKSASAG